MSQLGTEQHAETEPLHVGLWFQAIARLAKRLEKARDEDVAACIRQAFHLLKLSPLPLRAAFPHTLSDSEFEAMLEDSEADAVTALLGPILHWRLPSQNPAIASLCELKIDPDMAFHEVVDLSSARSILLGLCYLVGALDPETVPA